MKKEDLTQERLKELLVYDFNKGVSIWVAKCAPRSKIKIGIRAGKSRKDGYRRISIDNVRYLEHRLVWLYVHRQFPSRDKPFIDHVDMDKANNRIENLRVCNNAENMRNRSKNSNNTTGYKGVRQDKRDKRYYPRIQNPLTNKYESLGGYLTPEEASEVFQIKSIEYYGDFHPDKLLHKGKIKHENKNN